MEPRKRSSSSTELYATRFVPAEMRVDVEEAEALYTRYLSRVLRMDAAAKRGKQVHTVLDEANGSAILHLQGEEGQQLRCST